MRSVKTLVKKLLSELFSEYKNARRSTVEIGFGTRICPETQIGNKVYIGRNCTITRANIGDYVSIANNVEIGPGNHDLNASYMSSFINKDQDLTLGDIIIGQDAWIGAGVVILRDVTIGKGAVVGAGAVVNTSIPDYAVAVGVPARILKYRKIMDQES